MPDLALDGVSVMLRGAFAPPMFSPDWLLRLGLINADEHSELDLRVISPSLTSFDVAWLGFHATQDSLQVTTTDQAEFERARDVMVGIITALTETPLGALGINRDSHIALQNTDQWHYVGDTLAPKGRWEGLIPWPGMRTVVILGGRDDLYAGSRQVQVEPSFRIPVGVYVASNEHYLLSKVEKQLNPRDPSFTQPPAQPVEFDIKKRGLALEILSEDWSNAFVRSTQALELISQIADEAPGGAA